jgi:hypothetical protein
MLTSTMAAVIHAPGCMLGIHGGSSVSVFNLASDNSGHHHKIGTITVHVFIMLGAGLKWRTVAYERASLVV